MSIYTEEDFMDQQGKDETVTLSSYAMAPITMLKAELVGIYGKELLSDINDIIKLYAIYEKGAKFSTEGAKDYTPSQLKFKQAKSLVDKEARFMFARTPSFKVETKDRKKATVTQAFISEVIKKNRFGRKILQAAKDCFIGKRVALFLNFNKDSGITISFAPSLEFIYEVDENDADKLTKIVRFYALNDSYDKSVQRIYKKKYWIDDSDGLCHIEEGIYNGKGEQIVEEGKEPPKPIITKFDFIPAYIIVNDGLTGDTMGESEIDVLREQESYYSKLANADIDSLRKGMNQVVWARDMDPKSTKNLSRAPGSVWDLSTDTETLESGGTGEVGTLDNPMDYSEPLDTTLERIKGAMFESLDIPDTSADALKGVVSSGKTMKAIYWGLMTRCDEKMHAWRPALEWMVDTIIKGATAYPESRGKYIEQGKLEKNYEIIVESNYPILEDEIEEKASDLLEVNAQTMSRKSYMQKWRELTDEEVMSELKQIALERQMLEDSFMPPGNGSGDGSSGTENDTGNQNAGTGGAPGAPEDEQEDDEEEIIEG